MFRHTRIIKESSIFDTIPEGGIVLKDSNTMRRYSLHYSSVRSWLYCRWHFFNNCLGQAKYSWMYVVDCIRGETSFEGSLWLTKSQRLISGWGAEWEQPKVRMVTEPLRKHWGRGWLRAPYSPFKSCYANKYILGIVAKPHSGQVLSKLL